MHLQTQKVTPPKAVPFYMQKITENCENTTIFNIDFNGGVSSIRAILDILILIENIIFGQKPIVIHPKYEAKPTPNSKLLL